MVNVAKYFPYMDPRNGYWAGPKVNHQLSSNWPLTPKSWKLNQRIPCYGFTFSIYFNMFFLGWDDLDQKPLFVGKAEKHNNMNE